MRTKHDRENDLLDRSIRFCHRGHEMSVTKRASMIVLRCAPCQLVRQVNTDPVVTSCSVKVYEPVMHRGHYRKDRRA